MYLHFLVFSMILRHHNLITAPIFLVQVLILQFEARFFLTRPFHKRIKFVTPNMRRMIDQKILASDSRLNDW